jgi:hypothetical protein
MIELIAAIITSRWLADTSVLHHINPVRFRLRLEERYVARRPRHRDRHRKGVGFKQRDLAGCMNLGQAPAALR